MNEFLEDYSESVFVRIMKDEDKVEISHPNWEHSVTLNKFDAKFLGYVLTKHLGSFKVKP